jgi:SAM-dependent methyltransferase
VFEHLPYPADFLKHISRFLTPNGVLIAQMPNWNSIWRVIFPRDWTGLHIPRHQSFFTPTTLRFTFKGAGMSVRRIIPIFDPGELASTFANKICRRFGLRTPPRKVWFFLPLVILVSPLALIQVLFFRNSGCMEVTAERPRKEG